MDVSFLASSKKTGLVSGCFLLFVFLVIGSSFKLMSYGILILMGETLKELTTGV